MGITPAELDRILHGPLDPPTPPSEDATVERLVVDIRQWANTITYETYQQLIERPNTYGPEFLHLVGRRIDRACELLLAKIRPELCKVCGGSGFVAQKQTIGDGYGEVDSCPACDERASSVGAPVREDAPDVPCVFQSVEGVAYCTTHRAPFSLTASGWRCETSGTLFPFGTPSGTAATLSGREEAHAHCYDLVCNGSRQYPRGEAGHGCSCGTRARREHAEQIGREEALRTLLARAATCLLDPDDKAAARAVVAEIAAALTLPAPDGKIELACPRCKEHGDQGATQTKDGWMCVACGHEYQTPDRWQRLPAATTTTKAK